MRVSGVMRGAEVARAPVAGVARRGLVPLIVSGVLIEAVLLLGWLEPLSLWRTPSNLPAGAPMVLILGQDWAGALRFAVPAAALVVLWGAALYSSRRLSGTTATMIAIAFSALFLATLIPMNPAGTQDIYHNVADGRLFWLHGVNPTLIPPQAFPEDAFAPHVWGYADLPSAYGPAWYELTGIPTLLAGDGLIGNLVAQKILVAAFWLGTVVAVAITARTIAPDRAVAAVVLLGWSPLFVWELAGNGHNDSVMAFFLAVALLAAARRAYLWVLPALALSVLVKYTTALVVPVALIWLLRRPDVPPRQVLWSAAIAVALTLVVFAPMEAGWDTVAGLRRPGMTFILSPATLAHGALVAWLTDDTASRLVRLVTGVLFLAGYVWVLATTRGDARDLAARCFDALVLYLLLASWWFWPWYLTWLGPPAVLARGMARPAAFALFAAGALFTYLYWWPDPVWRSPRWFVAYGAIAAGVFAVPAAVWLAGLLRERRGRQEAVQAASRQMAAP
jgi:hypothetical protein